MPESCNTIIQLKTDWADLDLFGHVNNVAFFRYIQASRVNYCDQIGLSSLNKSPLSFMVASTQCQFKKPLFFPEDIRVKTRVNWIKNSSFQLDHFIINKEDLVCAEGSDILVVYDHFKKEKRSVDGELRKKIEQVEKKKFEAIR